MEEILTKSKESSKYFQVIEVFQLARFYSICPVMPRDISTENISHCHA
jgi:hypothetical protein